MCVPEIFPQFYILRLNNIHIPKVYHVKKCVCSKDSCKYESLGNFFNAKYFQR